MSTTSKAQRRRSRGVKKAQQRGKEAVAALIATAVVRAISVGVSTWQMGLIRDVEPGDAALHLSDTIFRASFGAELGMVLISGVLFLRWLAQAVKGTRALQVSPPLVWTPSQAVWGFFIPLVNLARPYQVLRDLHDRLAPDGVPEPAPRRRLDGVGGYRTIAVEKAPPPAKLPHASIGAWWALYILGGLMARAATSGEAASMAELLDNRTLFVAADILEIGSAALAILVVRAVSGRLAERQRRLHHATDEELMSWGVDP